MFNGSYLILILQQGGSPWGNLQKGSVEEDLGGTLQGIIFNLLLVLCITLTKSCYH